MVPEAVDPVAALAAELEAAGVVVDDMDEDGLVVLALIDERFGPEEDTWVPLPASYGLTIWLTLDDGSAAGDDVRVDADLKPGGISRTDVAEGGAPGQGLTVPWLVVLETPTLTGLGDMAELTRRVEATDVLDWTSR